MKRNSASKASQPRRGFLFALSCNKEHTLRLGLTFAATVVYGFCCIDSPSGLDMTTEWLRSDWLLAITLAAHISY